MSNPDYESKMNRIIKTSQQMYLKDAAPRIVAVQQTIQKWKAGQVPDADAVEAIFLQIHTMKGVALTIHFEPMHRICEALIELLDQGDLAGAENLIEQLPNKLAECETFLIA
jgi:chemotaxis protein histidine kinase CheA